MDKWDDALHNSPSIQSSIWRQSYWWCLTRVEVFGFWQFDGGSCLFLQLDDGLTSFPDDRTRRIAGNQNLQEVLAFLCSREEETGSQIELLQCILFLLQKELEKHHNKQLALLLCLNLCPHACLVSIFFSRIHNNFFFSNFNKILKKLWLMQYMDHIVGLSVNCEEEATCLSVITVWQNRCEPVLHHYAKAE